MNLIAVPCLRISYIDGVVHIGVYLESKSGNKRFYASVDPSFFIKMIGNVLSAIRTKSSSRTYGHTVKATGVGYRILEGQLITLDNNIYVLSTPQAAVWQVDGTEGANTTSHGIKLILRHRYLLM